LRHLESVLAIPELNAVQFVPTGNEAEFIRWAGVYQRIQVAGKGLQVACTINEIDQVMEALIPYGVYLVVKDVPSLDAATLLLKKLGKWPLKGIHQVSLPSSSSQDKLSKNLDQPGIDK
jgi:hypothetical protein